MDFGLGIELTVLQEKCLALAYDFARQLRAGVLQVLVLIVDIGRSSVGRNVPVPARAARR
jgi:hypothetical protein